MEIGSVYNGPNQNLDTDAPTNGSRRDINIIKATVEIDRVYIMWESVWLDHRYTPSNCVFDLKNLNNSHAEMSKMDKQLQRNAPNVRGKMHVKRESRVR